MIEREQLRLSAERCPYCHEAVERSDQDKVACNACMAWHHAGCWNEHGACAACGADRTGLSPSTTAAGATGEHLPAERPPATWKLGILLIPLVPFLTFLALWTYNDNVEHVASDVREAILSASVVLGALTGGAFMLAALLHRRLTGAPGADRRPTARRTGDKEP